VLHFPELQLAIFVCVHHLEAYYLRKFSLAMWSVVSGVVWCGVVWCGVVWCGVVWCGVVWCGVVWCVVRRVKPTKHLFYRRTIKYNAEGTDGVIKVDRPIKLLIQYFENRLDIQRVQIRCQFA